MRYLTADYIFPISSPPIKDGIVVIDDNGKVLGIETSNFQPPTSNVEKYEGAICPGFINAHCHLEFSHMKGVIAEGLGMAGFIKGILSKRAASLGSKVMSAIIDAEAEMYENGIVGVGDISNDNSTLEQKKKGNIKYHTFFEVFDLDASKADYVFAQAEQLNKLYNTTMSEAGVISSSSIVPHAPYSVSQKLFSLIALQKKHTLISYHNQESIAESELYINKKGSIAELFSSVGIKLDYINAQGKNSLQSTIPYFSKEHKLLFVHNTFTSRNDIDVITSNFPARQAGGQRSTSSFCFCPNANLYIEGSLPDINLFIENNCKILVGTDSLASNHSLSILEELKVITKQFPQISLQTLLTWATKNGAEFFGWDKELGTIETGKAPGIVLIKDIDGEKLTGKSSVQRLA